MNLMWRLRRGGHTSTVETDPAQLRAEIDSDPAQLRAEIDSDPAQLRAEIDRLTAANRATPDRDVERRLLQLRHALGVQLVESADGAPQHAAPQRAALPDGPRLPEFAPGDLSAPLVRAGILRDGCVLVRGLIGRDDALALGAEIDRCFAERDRLGAGRPATPGYYEEFEPDPRYDVAVRPWVQAGGGVLAADSPKVAFEMFDLFEAAGVPRLVRDYLGEPPMVSIHKTTLRKADPEVAGAWHQDGAFMGEVRALNLWLSLSRCGDEAPGLDMVPRRLDHIVATGTSGTVVDFQVSQEVAEQAAGDAGIIRPVFEPGDALFFDDLFLHRTGSEASMPNPRYAVESWFFGGSGFPGDYAPIAV